MQIEESFHFTDHNKKLKGLGGFWIIVLTPFWFKTVCCTCFLNVNLLESFWENWLLWLFLLDWFNSTILGVASSIIPSIWFHRSIFVLQFPDFYLNKKLFNFSDLSHDYNPQIRIRIRNLKKKRNQVLQIQCPKK